MICFWAAIWTPSGSLDSTTTYTAGGRTLEFRGFERLRGGAGADTFEIVGDDLGLVEADLEGGAGDDRFVIHAGVTLLGSIDGQAGRDSLDYGAFDHPIAVQLTQSTADGMGGQQPDTLGVLGFRNIDRLVGTGAGVGSDVIAGLNVDGELDLERPLDLSDGAGWDGWISRALRRCAAGGGDDRYRLEPGPGFAVRLDDTGGDDTLDFRGVDGGDRAGSGPYRRSLRPLRRGFR